MITLSGGVEGSCSNKVPFNLGYDDAVFLDGSDSATLMVDGATFAQPDLRFISANNYAAEKLPKSFGPLPGSAIGRARQAAVAPRSASLRVALVGDQTGHRPHFNARQRAHHDDRFLASMCAFDVGWGSGNRVQVISASGALWACGWPFPSAVSGRFPVSNGEAAGFLKFFSCWLAMPTGARYPLCPTPLGRTRGRTPPPMEDWTIPTKTLYEL